MSASRVIHFTVRLCVTQIACAVQHMRRLSETTARTLQMKKTTVTTANTGISTNIEYTM